MILADNNRGGLMRSKIMMLLMAALLLAGMLVGCGGISQEQYDKIVSQFGEAQQKIEEGQGIVAGIEAEKEAALADLEEAREKAAELEAQVADLREQYELVGASPAEVAEKIVRNYHETHEYSTTDMFICGDMSSEIWNMLKAQGISARIAIGDIDTAVTNMLDCDHAWVLAEVAPGEYLALETTAGRVVPKSENALYYHGWYFDNPTSLKGYNEKVREYNTLVVVTNEIVREVNEAMNLYNNSTSQAEADKWMAVYETLVELKEAQEAKLAQIQTEKESLATPLQ
jgi:outer membrane murein-binding lipoprotein Lpp